MQILLHVVGSERSPIIHHVKERDGSRFPIELVREALDDRGENPATVESWKDAVRAPAIEVSERNASSFVVLFQEHRGDQEAAQYKKNHDTERSELKADAEQVIDEPEMVNKDEAYGQRP